jgi:hypothetical protein
MAITKAPEIGSFIHFELDIGIEVSSSRRVEMTALGTPFDPRETETKLDLCVQSNMVLFCSARAKNRASLHTYNERTYENS